MVVEKGPEKKGALRHKVISGPLRPANKNRLPLCLGVFVVQGF